MARERHSLVIWFSVNTDKMRSASICAHLSHWCNFALIPRTCSRGFSALLAAQSIGYERYSYAVVLFIYQHVTPRKTTRQKRYVVRLVLRDAALWWSGNELTFHGNGKTDVSSSKNIHHIANSLNKFIFHIEVLYLVIV